MLKKRVNGASSSGLPPMLKSVFSGKIEFKSVRGEEIGSKISPGVCETESFLGEKWTLPNGCLGEEDISSFFGFFLTRPHLGPSSFFGHVG